MGDWYVLFPYGMVQWTNPILGQILVVDGGAWHTASNTFPYPEVVLGQAQLTDDVKQRPSTKFAKL